MTAEIDLKLDESEFNELLRIVEERHNAFEAVLTAYRRELNGKDSDDIYKNIISHELMITEYRLKQTGLLIEKIKDQKYVQLTILSGKAGGK